jgi:hypothetical protein
MGRSVRPKALERRILICWAPMDMCRVWRIEESAKTRPVVF